jgi:hypothetical protein
MSSNFVSLQPPTSPLGAGVMEDTYSDRLDIMACCKGDYSLQNCILSGWVPARERVTLSLTDLTPEPAPAGAAVAEPLVRRYSLWPFDRPESKGQLKGVSLRGRCWCWASGAQLRLPAELMPALQSLPAACCVSGGSGNRPACTCWLPLPMWYAHCLVPAKSGAEA